jgi:hypothetical protein
MNKGKSVLYGVVVGIIILALSGCNLPSRSRVEVEILSPADGQSVVLGQEVRIVSTAGSTKGIQSVDLFVNGDLLSMDTPPGGTPKEYSSDQPWGPSQEGNVVISIVARDAKDNASEPVSILVVVVQSISEAAETPSPTITATSEALPQTPTQTEEGACTKSASFIEDITIPDNSVLAAGSSFTKIWRIRNTGTCDWVSYQFIHASGDLMGSSSSQALPVISSTSVADISVDLVAPVSPGTYTTSWRIRASDGTVFGPELFLTIIIPQPPTNTPNVTVTPTVTPTVTTGPLSVQQYSETVSIPGGGTENKTVTCPAGSVVVSGGFATSVDVRVWHQTKDGNSWRVYATNTNTANRQIIIYAHCLHNSGGTTNIALNQVNINPNDKTQLIAVCPAGSVVTGGAWVIGTDPAVELYNSSPSGNGWQIWVDNTGGGSPLINVYAICLSGVSGTTSYVTNTSGTIPPGDYIIHQKDCPSGTYATGGGYAINTGAVVYNTSLNGNAWKNSARNDTATQKLMYTYAMCYSP